MCDYLNSVPLGEGSFSRSKLGINIAINICKAKRHFP